jgi:hypothetical protein
MKDVTFTVEITSHVLANGTGEHNRRDTFQRDSQNRLIFQQNWWYSAFSTTLDMLRIRGIKPSDIFMDLTVDAQTEIYHRRYGQNQVRVHEAIMPGTRVTFHAVVADHVTRSTLTAILERMGRFVGLSPYGHKLGYGHFNLLELHVTPSESAFRGSTNDAAVESYSPSDSARRKAEGGS